MNKKQAVKSLELTADLLEVLGEDEFRILAYRKAARNLENIDWDEAKAHNFQGLAGIGAQLSTALKEFAETGHFPLLDELLHRVPPGALELFRVRGLGPKRIKNLLSFGIDSLDNFLIAAQSGELTKLKGFGQTTVQKLLPAAEFAQNNLGRVLLPKALTVFRALKEQLPDLELAGEARRGLETVNSLQLLTKTVIADNFSDIDGLKIEFLQADDDNFGAVLAVATGSEKFISRLSEKAQNLSYKLTAQGLYHNNKLVPTANEKELFDILKLPFVPTYWREAEHIGLETPKALQKSQIKGLLHVHSDWSDGVDSLKTMVQAAKDQGFEYIGICDHSQLASYAGGLSPERVKAQWNEIERLRDELQFPILKGIESDIRSDGNLDYEDEILAGFDFIVASVHSNFDLSFEDQTKRLVKAVSNPFTTILAHPTGRLLLTRRGYSFDLNAVFAAAAKNNTVIELNSNPHRLDLDWRGILACQYPLNWAINTDAHSVSGLDDLEFGILMANKAGLIAEKIVNCLSVKDFLSFKKIATV